MGRISHVWPCFCRTCRSWFGTFKVEPPSEPYVVDIGALAAAGFDIGARETANEACREVAQILTGRLRVDDLQLELAGRCLLRHARRVQAEVADVSERRADCLRRAEELRANARRLMKPNFNMRYDHAPPECGPMFAQARRLEAEAKRMGDLEMLLEAYVNRYSDQLQQLSMHWRR